MTAFQLIVSPFQISQINRFSVEKHINEHVLMKIGGVISQDVAKNIQSEQVTYKDITVTLKEEEEERLLFRGLISELELNIVGNLFQIELSALSYTFLLDQNEICLRTFQEKRQTYHDIAREVIDTRRDSSMIYLYEEKVADSFVIQYKESDWAFLKRMASNAHTFLIADCFSNKASVYFGMQKRKKKLEISAKNHKVCDYMKENRILRKYIIESDIFADVGDIFLYNNREMQIFSAKIELVSHELRCFYTLKNYESIECEENMNARQAGVSLYGFVKKVRSEKIQVTLTNDIGKQTGLTWFDYATVYSSSDCSGWYCMPEEGDKICLYFPDENPTHAYVMNAMHELEAKGRMNPENKYIRTKRNQEICFAPGRITITNHKGLSVILDDQKGVEIKSSKDILLDANGMIGLNCRGAVLAKGEDSVVLKQNANMIAVRNGIREHGVRIERL